MLQLILVSVGVRFDRRSNGDCDFSLFTWLQDTSILAHLSLRFLQLHLTLLQFLTVNKSLLGEVDIAIIGHKNFE